MIPRMSDEPAPAAIELLVPIVLGLVLSVGLGWGVWRLAPGSAMGMVGGFVVALATLGAWLLIATPGDPVGSRFVVWLVPGPVRILGEITFFCVAAAVIWKAGSRAAAESLLTVAALHYALTWERIRWLLRRSTRTRVPDRDAVKGDGTSE